METLFPQLPAKEVNQMNMLALAHVGDAVYELLVRAKLCREKKASVMRLHRLTVEQVRAEAQARAAAAILPAMTEEEQAVYRRGRNSHVHGIPPHANAAEYHSATGLEAVFGWLWLQGKTERIRTLFAAAQGAEEL